MYQNYKFLENCEKFFHSHFLHFREKFHVLSFPGMSSAESADESTNLPPFSRRQPSAQHLKTGRTRDCNSSYGQSAIVLTSTFAPTMPDRSNDKFCKVWQCLAEFPVFSSNQMQLAMAGSSESIRMATVESFRASCSKMSIQFQGAMRMLLLLCSLLANVLIRLVIRASQPAWYYLSTLQGS